MKLNKISNAKIILNSYYLANKNIEISAYCLKGNLF